MLTSSPFHRLSTLLSSPCSRLQSSFDFLCSHLLLASIPFRRLPLLASSPFRRVSCSRRVFFSHLFLRSHHYFISSSSSIWCFIDWLHWHFVDRPPSAPDWDLRLQQTMVEIFPLKSADAAYNKIIGMITTLDDPFTRIINPKVNSQLLN